MLHRRRCRGRGWVTSPECPDWLHCPCTGASGECGADGDCQCGLASANPAIRINWAGRFACDRRPLEARVHRIQPCPPDRRCAGRAQRGCGQLAPRPCVRRRFRCNGGCRTRNRNHFRVGDGLPRRRTIPSVGTDRGDGRHPGGHHGDLRTAWHVACRGDGRADHHGAWPVPNGPPDPVHPQSGDRGVHVRNRTGDRIRTTGQRSRFGGRELSATVPSPDCCHRKSWED